MFNDKTIIRTVKKSQYVTINNSVFTDSRLSWKAKGLMGYLLSRPDNWKVIVGDLVKQSKDGRDAVYSGIKELKKNGYLEQRPIRNEEGKKSIIRWEYIVYEEPICIESEPLTENPEVDKKSTNYPLTDFPYVDNPDVDNPTLLNKDSSNKEMNQRLIKQQQETPENPKPVVVDEIKKGLEQIGAKISDKEVTKWIGIYGENYVLGKIEVTRESNSTAPLRTLRAAIKENWDLNHDNDKKNDYRGKSERQKRVVPAAQSGKYERFYQVYGNQLQNNSR